MEVPVEVPVIIMNASETSDTSLIDNFESKLSEYEQQHQGNKRKPWTNERIFEVIDIIRKAKDLTMSNKQRRTSMEYYWMSKYDIATEANEDHLILKRKSSNDQLVRIIPRNEYFSILMQVHESSGHGGRDKMIQAIKSKYYIPKKAVEIFLELCPACGARKQLPKKGTTTRPIASEDFNIRGQVDLVDFQSCPDGEFKWLLKYQDDATKFLSLRPLTTNNPSNVALELMKIFTIFGAPYILQSDNGRVFTANVIEELTAIWPECKVVHGSPKTEQNIGRSQDIENMLSTWMESKKSASWSVGCYHVQYEINASVHCTTGRSPYKALFGSDPKAGLSGSGVPSSVLMNVSTEEQLTELSKLGFVDVSGQRCNSVSESERNPLETIKIEVSADDEN